MFAGMGAVAPPATIMPRRASAPAASFHVLSSADAKLCSASGWVSFMSAFCTARPMCVMDGVEDEAYVLTKGATALAADVVIFEGAPWPCEARRPAL